MKVTIYDKHPENHPDITQSLCTHINKYNFEIDESNPDVVFCVGGDGTFLKAVHQFINKLENILFVGICVPGSFGFFYDGNSKDIPSIFESLKNKDANIEKCYLLSAEIISGDKKDVLHAVNEIRIENPFHTLISDVDVDGKHLEVFRGNGLVVSSAIGSSAYNRSLGGALIDSSLKLIELTEIASIQHNEYRSLGSSLILDGKSVISLSGDFSNVVVGYDSFTHSNKEFSQIKITLSNKCVKLLRGSNYSYIQKLEKSYIK